MKSPLFSSQILSQVSSWGRHASAAFALLLSVGSAHSATTYYWDANGGGAGTGGSGTWDTTNLLWRAGSSGGALSQWPSADPSSSIARFEGTAGIVTLDGTSIYANGLSFGDQNWEVRSSNSLSKLVLNGTNPSIAFGSPTGTRVFSLNTAVELFSGTTTLTKSGINVATLGLGFAPTTAASGTSSLTIASGGSFNIASLANRIRITVGRQNGTGALTAVNSTFDLSGGEVTAYLETLQVGWRTLAAAAVSSGNVTAMVNFGSDADSIVNISSTTQSAAVVGYLELEAASTAYTGSAAGTLNIGGGTNTFSSSAASAATLHIGQATNRGLAATNGANVANATGILNITGGTTTVSATATATANAIALASRDTALGVNTTASGTLNVTGGILNVSGDDIYGGGGTSTVTLNGGAINFGGGNLGRSGGLITNLNFESGTLSNVNQINNGANLTKTTSGTLIFSGTNAYTGSTLVNAGTLLVNGTLANTASVQVSAGATLGGSGSIGATISGDGTVAPGNSPGILRAEAVDGTLGLDFTFEITSLNPDYDSPTSSLNDVLRLTDATPFTSPLGAGNVITINFSGVTLLDGQIYSGGFYADAGDFSSSISGATYVFQGADGFNVVVNTAQQTADFGTGDVNGWVTQFEINVIPEPSTSLLLTVGLMTLLFFRRRNSTKLS